MLSNLSLKVRDVADRVAKKKDGWPKVLEEGRFTTYCKKNGFKGPCKACADLAMKSPDPSVRGMSSFYINTTLKVQKKKASGGGE